MYPPGGEHAKQYRVCHLQHGSTANMVILTVGTTAVVKRNYDRSLVGFAVLCEFVLIADLFVFK